MIEKLKELKRELRQEGFIIEGYFGSYARGTFQEGSDLDILYSLTPAFLERYGGFRGFKKLEEIRRFMEDRLGVKVDLAPKNALSKTAKKYIYKDLIVC